MRSINDLRHSRQEQAVDGKIAWHVAELAQRIDGPINVLLTPKMPSAAELAALGAARLTWGAGLAGLAYKEAARVVGETLSE
jgi:2-methylisocitrate lyase-like PEP mutase family enzyme